MRYREPAICVRTTDFSETSQVVQFFTRDQGLVSLLAKGSKRKKSSTGGAVDLLSEGDLVFTDAGQGALGTLIEFSEEVSHLSLRRDAGKLYTALYMLELVAATMAEGDPHPECFDLLHNALTRLGAADAPVAPVLAYFQLRLLRRIGLLGGLRRCVACDEEVAAGREAWFTSREGGLLCDRCETAAPEKFRVHRPAMAGLAALVAAEAGQKVRLPDDQARAVSRLLDYHAREQLGKPLKTSRYAIPPYPSPGTGAGAGA